MVQYLVYMALFISLPLTESAGSKFRPGLTVVKPNEIMQNMPGQLQHYFSAGLPWGYGNSLSAMRSCVKMGLSTAVYIGTDGRSLLDAGTGKGRRYVPYGYN